ncbi:hypothetical protein [Thiothrix unzii]|jgi:hypothetical protein|uniref:hypothetical protein n=1 Tax=Thiothrix unzii TaxID=111769 RepID=UPI002A367CD9|nr:hypothetical protein [Thiothrix unzii]MDX9988654.1 hypothetical protein [Thiothrix unzii]
MSDNKMTTAYALHSDMTDLQRSAHDERQALKVNRWAQQFFTVATWIIYLMFAAAMYGAPLWVLQAFFGANAGNYIAIIVIGLFLVVLPTALAMGKHSGYKALSKRGIDPRWMGAIIAFFIASGIYFEMTSATSQQQEKAHQAVENSNAGKAIMGTTVSTGTSAYASLLADAEFKLVACQRKLSEGKVKDCANSTAKVNSLKEQSAADRQAAITANTAAITAKQSALDKEREAHALPIAKSFAELFGSTIATGAVIAALIAALIFEISHSLTIYNEWRLKLEIDRLEGSFKRLKVDYFHQTGKQFEATDFKEGEIIDLMEMRESGKIEHFKDRLQDAVQPEPEPEKKGGDFGFIRHGQTAQSSARLDAENRRKYPQEILYPTGKGKTADDYALIPREDFKRTGKTYRDELRTGSQDYRDMPLDATTTTPAEKPRVKPLEQQAEKPRVEPRARGLEKADENPVHGVTEAPRPHAATDTLYLVWIAAVRSGECRASIDSTRAWIQKRIAPVMTGSKTNDLKRIDQMRKGFFSRALREGLMQINPAYRNGGKKYNWIG